MRKGSAVFAGVVFAGVTGFCFVDEVMLLSVNFSYHCHRLLNRISLRRGERLVLACGQRITVHYGGKA